MPAQTPDWSKLTGASGAADDVPQLLRVAERGDLREREAAWAELSTCLTAQGRVYEATSHAVPFLYELLDRAQEPEDREAALGLLGSIARARAPGDGGGRGWVEAAHAAVAKRAHAAIEHLRDSRPAVRLNAAALLATGPDEAAFVKALADVLPRERALDVRVAIGLALAALGSLVTDAFAGDDDDLPLPRLQALARAALEGGAARECLFDVLSELSAGAFDESRLDGLGG